MPKTRRLSDATLVRRSQQGDRRAFGALLGRYDRRLRGLAHALLLDARQMDAALGLAYLRAWRDVVRVNTRDDVAAWLYRGTYNACIDQLRRGDPPAADAASRANGQVDPVLAGLAQLAPADRVAVVLVDREGFSPVSAARILGLSQSALTDRVEIAREQLAVDLGIPVGAAAGPATSGDGADDEDAENDGVAEDDLTVEGDGVAQDDPSGEVDGAADDGESAEGDGAEAADEVAEVDQPAGGNGSEAGNRDAENDPGVVGNGTAGGNGSGNGGAPAGGRGRRARKRARYAASRQSRDTADTTDDDTSDDDKS